MSFNLKEVVPWGRSYNEYISMFNLSAEDLKKKILGCGDGPASFNATLTRRGGNIISVDPIYQFSSDEIQARIAETYHEVIDQTRQNIHEFVWDHIPSIEKLGQVRMVAMKEFLLDYIEGLKEGRYLQAALPQLPFKEKSFELALCSHFLFLYSQQLSLDFHLQSLLELQRISKEIRIFPLLEMGTKESRHLSSIIEALKRENLSFTIETVPYEFQKGGNKMLKILSKK